MSNTNVKKFIMDGADFPIVDEEARADIVDINNSLTQLVTITPSGGITMSHNSVTCSGKLVGGSAEIQLTASANSWIELGSISKAPTDQVTIPAVRTGNGTHCGMVKIFPSNDPDNPSKIRLYSTQALSGNAVGFSFSYKTS